MKPDIRWQALLAFAGLALVGMLLSYQVQSAALCTVSVPAAGGTFVEGIVGRPFALNPLFSDPYPVDRELTDLIFDGLVRYDQTGQPLPALAQEWSVSEDGLTFTFTLREGLVWHDGEPLTSRDVAFTYGLIQHEDFPGPEHLQRLWQSVIITPLDERRIAFTLTQPYAPFIEATTRGILPAHLLEDVAVGDLISTPFNLSPVGTGPFMVQPGQDWQRTGRIRLTPNPNYWREGTQIADLEIRFYPTAEELQTSYRAGELHAVLGFPSTMIPQVMSESDARLFTSTAPRYSALLFNVSGSGAAALLTKEVRQALAYSIDRDLLVNSVLNGQGVVFDGPYTPEHWAARPDLLTAYSRQPDRATALLDGAGWTGPGVRTREGVPLRLRLLVPDQADYRAVAEEISRQWATVGVEAQIVPAADADALRKTLSERSYDVALVEIAAPNDPDLYDFWSQEAMVRGQNFAGWNNRRASEALEAGRQVFPQGERVPYYEAFQRQFDADLPQLTLYQHVSSYLLRDDVQQAEVGLVQRPRDRYESFPAWFLNYRDVAVSCPAEGSS